MLTQYCLTLRPDREMKARSEWAYRLYAALLALAPPAFGEEAHQDNVTPVSQFLQIQTNGTLLWTVNLLGEESERLLSPVLEQTDRYQLHKDAVGLQVEKQRKSSIFGVDSLFAYAGRCTGKHELQICTPAAFKSRGQYLNLPTTRLIIQNLVKKWNGCFLDCPIEDEDGQGVEAISAGLRCRSFALHDRLYYLKGNSVPGFVGTLTLENRLDGFQRQFADVLLVFSGYAGIGIKTTLGMGGVRHRFLP